MPLLQVLTLLALQRLRVALVAVLVLMRASLPMLETVLVPKLALHCMGEEYLTRCHRRCRCSDRR